MKSLALAGAIIAVLLLSRAPGEGAAAVPYMLEVRMFGDQQVPPVKTGAWGFVLFYFNEDRSRADYTVDVKGMSANLVTGADIHRAPRGENGPVVYHLADGNFLVRGGSMRFEPRDLDEIARGLWYVSLKSLAYPEGELRGQVVLPEGFWPDGAAVPPAASDDVPPTETVQAPSAALPLPALPIAAAAAPVDRCPPGSCPPRGRPDLPVQIRPPNTGDGGLAAARAGGWISAAQGLALLLIGVAAFAVPRFRPS